MEIRDYFRIEAEELIGRLTAGLRAEEVPWPEMRRAAHTLKGAANVVHERAMGETAHTLEDALRAEHVSESIALVDTLAEMLERAFSPLPQASPAVAAPPKSHEDETQPAATLRVDLQQTDALLRVLEEARAELATLRAMRPGSSEEDSRVRGAEIVRRATKLERHLAEAEHVALGLRLAPAEAMLLRVERAARRAAETNGIALECRITGGDERVDVHLLTEAEEAMQHLARNAVAHGFAGQQRTGHIQIGVERRGTTLAFFCADDGRGIDTEMLRAEMVRGGWMGGDEAKRADRASLLRMLTQPGITTRRHVDESAGRGIGLDVVRTKARQLGGELEIESEAGKGTRFTMLLPESLYSVSCLILAAQGQEFAVPMTQVVQTLSLAGHPIDESGNIRVHHAQVPVVESAALLGLSPKRDVPSGGVAVMVRAGEQSVALRADRVLRMETVVTETTEESWGAEAWVGGTYRDALGSPRLVLRTAGIGSGAALPKVTKRAARVPLPVLVIDDSVTSRALEESILTSAGFEVDTASSAEEGMAMANARDYGLYLVDVEMPGMDGFEFVTRTRADLRMRAVPVVMVTSRNRPGDRERGIVAGASDYVLKGEFDQEKWMATVRRLVRVRVGA